MSFLKYLVPALAVAGLTQAASCSTKGTMTITAAADASALASCSTYTGNIAFHTKAVGDFALDGPRTIEGDITAEGAPNITSVSSSTIQTIAGTFTLDNLVGLSAIMFPMLTEVDSIAFVALGLNTLATLGFDSIVTKVRNLQIDTTFLTSLDGISPTTAEMVSITNNINFQRLNLQLTNVSKAFVMTGNNALGFTVALPKLKFAELLQINRASSVAVPKLANVGTGGVSLYDSSFSSVQFPMLKDTGSLTLQNNSALRSFAIPKLKTIDGALNVQNNTALKGSLSFPQVTTIKGAATIVGAFSTLNFPKLNLIGGKVTISSTKNIDNTVCKDFSSLPSNVIQSSLSCHGKASNSNDQNGNQAGNGGGGNNNGGGNGGNAAGHIQASLGSVLSAFGAVAAAIVALL